VRTSIATVSLSGTLENKLAAIAKAGFMGVELFEQDLLTADASPRTVRQMLGDLGLELVTFQPFRDFEGMPEAVRQKNLIRAEYKLDLMLELGTDLLLVCSNVSPQALGGLDRAAEDLFALGELAAARGLRVGFEALAWGQHISDYRDAWEVVRRANHPAVGTILDTFHILAKGLEVGAIANIPKEKIYLVQVADAPSLEMGVLPWSRHYRNFPGQGRLPLGAFMQALSATRYDGYFSLEIFNDQFRAAPSSQTALDGLRSLHYLHETQKAVQVHGVGFVEFAVSERRAVELSQLFMGLGFIKVGQHRSKNVSLWRQGQAQLVLNAENAGFALEYKAQHGSSVCAVALVVECLADAITRAKRYKYRVLEPDVRPGEQPIPAVVGTDGSLIYLLEHGRNTDEFWSADFELVPQTDLPQSTLANFAVDHIGQVLPFSQSLSWLLFYRSLFVLDASNLTNIPDPGGLITSQVVENQDRSLRFVLNASQYAGTLATKYIAGHAGGGIQHVAFVVQDILATLQGWADAGIALLQLSPNYYADLQAKYHFEPNLLAQMQRLGVMYDADHNGEFFHAYTQTFADFFFFEVCQRRNYDGYGAVNAAVRVAAQSRDERAL
jgi:4-hydroxyphenylpyruvate dioxygenase